MTQEELQKLVKQISQVYFKTPFQHQARFNARLKTTGGRYLLMSHDLEFNPKMTDLPEFLGIIKHELTHYHLHIKHQGYRHQDRDFKLLLQRVDGVRYAPKLSSDTSKYWHYCCAQGHDIFRKRRFKVEKYRCAQCGSQLNLIGLINQE